MYVRTNTVRRGTKTYRYHQLVESVRKPGGGVSKRVIASLGQLSEVELANLQAALEASRREQRVAVVVPTAAATRLRPPDASLGYLDIAALLEVWNTAGFAALLDGVLPRRSADIPPADVVAALAVHRCVAGRSKLHAESWLPTTALPELLAISPKAFHNTRLHRVLDQLHLASPEIQRRLPTTYGLERDAVAAFYLDITDTWFVGHGPTLAKAGRTKDDAIRHKIGIILLCTDDGRPLRWQVLAGDQAEAPAMLELLRSERWTRGAGPPVVIDRAMGKTAYIQELLAADVPFLTALTRPEFAAYAPRLPLTALDEVAVPAAASVAELAPVCAAVEAAGMKRATDDLFLMDLGIVGGSADESTVDDVDDDDAAIDGMGNATSHKPRSTQSGLGSGREALELAKQIQADVDAGIFPTKRAAGAHRGLTLVGTKRVGRLLGLAAPAQDALASGLADHVSIAALHDILVLSADAQRDALLARQATSRGRRQPLPASNARRAAPEIPRVRAVAYFNPKIWWQQRQSAARRLEAVSAFVADLNAQLRSPKSRRTVEQAQTCVRRYLSRMDHLTAFDLAIRTADCAGREVVEVELSPNAAWTRRRRLDGFSVLVAHPSVTMPAEDLARRYRAKDVIEKDFQVIKSLVRLRPVWHHNDTKVRAHVTLCMLALALEREMHRRLKTTTSVAAALESWSTVRIQRYGANDNAGDLYTLTRPDPAQLKLLTTAGLAHLADDHGLASRITPRHML